MNFSMLRLELYCMYQYEVIISVSLVIYARHFAMIPSLEIKYFQGAN